MARIQPTPVTIAAVAPSLRYQTPEPETPGPALGTLDADQFRRFEAILAHWKTSGTRISFDDLKRAAHLAREEDQDSDDEKGRHP